MEMNKAELRKTVGKKSESPAACNRSSLRNYSRTQRQTLTQTFFDGSLEAQSSTQNITSLTPQRSTTPECLEQQDIAPSSCLSEEVPILIKDASLQIKENIDQPCNPTTTTGKNFRIDVRGQVTKERKFFKSAVQIPDDKPLDIVDVSKVLKLISAKPSKDVDVFEVRPPNKTKLKTYSNKRRTLTPSSIIESFALPDEPIVPADGSALEDSSKITNIDLTVDVNDTLESTSVMCLSSNIKENGKEIIDLSNEKRGRGLMKINPVSFKSIMEENSQTPTNHLASTTNPIITIEDLPEPCISKDKVNFQKNVNPPTKGFIVGCEENMNIISSLPSEIRIIKVQPQDKSSSVDVDPPILTENPPKYSANTSDTKKENFFSKMEHTHAIKKSKFTPLPKSFINKLTVVNKKSNQMQSKQNVFDNIKHVLRSNVDNSDLLRDKSKTQENRNIVDRISTSKGYLKKSEVKEEVISISKADNNRNRINKKTANEKVKINPVVNAIKIKQQVEKAIADNKKDLDTNRKIAKEKAKPIPVVNAINIKQKVEKSIADNIKNPDMNRKIAKGKVKPIPVENALNIKQHVKKPIADNIKNRDINRKIAKEKAKPIPAASLINIKQKVEKSITDNTKNPDITRKIAKEKVKPISVINPISIKPKVEKSIVDTAKNPGISRKITKERVKPISVVNPINFKQKVEKCIVDKSKNPDMNRKIAKEKVKNINVINPISINQKAEIPIADNNKNPTINRKIAKEKVKNIPVINLNSKQEVVKKVLPNETFKEGATNNSTHRRLRSQTTIKDDNIQYLTNSVTIRKVVKANEPQHLAHSKLVNASKLAQTEPQIYQDSHKVPSNTTAISKSKSHSKIMLNPVKYFQATTAEQEHKLTVLKDDPTSLTELKKITTSSSQTSADICQNVAVQSKTESDPSINNDVSKNESLQGGMPKRVNKLVNSEIKTKEQGQYTTIKTQVHNVSISPNTISKKFPKIRLFLKSERYEISSNEDICEIQAITPYLDQKIKKEHPDKRSPDKRSISKLKASGDSRLRRSKSDGSLIIKRQSKDIVNFESTSKTRVESIQQSKKKIKAASDVLSVKHASITGAGAQVKQRREDTSRVVTDLLMPVKNASEMIKCGVDVVTSQIKKEPEEFIIDNLKFRRKLKRPKPKYVLNPMKLKQQMMSTQVRVILNPTAVASLLPMSTPQYNIMQTESQGIEIPVEHSEPTNVADKTEQILPKQHTSVKNIDTIQLSGKSETSTRVKRRTIKKNPIFKGRILRSSCGFTDGTLTSEVATEELASSTELFYPEPILERKSTVTTTAEVQETTTFLPELPLVEKILSTEDKAPSDDTTLLPDLPLVEKLPSTVDKAPSDDINSDHVDSKPIAEGTLLLNPVGEARRRHMRRQAKVSEESEKADPNLRDGDLAWAQIGKFPYWPCMITQDPKNKVHKRYTKVQVRLMYHVRFFYDNGRRAWVSAQMIIPYKNKDDLDILKQHCQEKLIKLANPKGVIKSENGKVILTPKELDQKIEFQTASKTSRFIFYEVKPGLVRNWSLAVAEAESLKEKPAKERLEYFVKFLADKLESRRKLLILDSSEEEVTSDGQRTKDKKIYPSTVNPDITAITSTIIPEQRADFRDSKNAEFSKSEIASCSKIGKTAQDEIPSLLKPSGGNEVILSKSELASKPEFIAKSKQVAAPSSPLEGEPAPDSKKSSKRERKFEAAEPDPRLRKRRHQFLTPDDHNIKLTTKRVKTEDVRDISPEREDETSLQKLRKRRMLEKTANEDEIMDEHEKSSPLPAKLKDRRHLLIQQVENSDSDSKFSENSSVPTSLSSQEALYRRNKIFRGVSKDKVCQVCGVFSKVFKCRGPCNGIYHNRCINGVPVPTTANSFLDAEKSSAQIKTEKTKSPDRRTSGYNVEIISVVTRKSRENILPKFTSPKSFKNMSLGDQIDFRMKQVMEKMQQQSTYTDSTDSSSEELVMDEYPDASEAVTVPPPSSTIQIKSEVRRNRRATKEPVPMIKHVTADNVSYICVADDEESSKEEQVLVESDPPKATIPEDKLPIYPRNYMCRWCSSQLPPPCFVCNEEESASGSKFRQKCSLRQCGKFYHPECLKVWPQTQWSLISSTKDEWSDAKYDTFVCPRHVCHTCISDDPRAASTRCSSDKVVKCLRCPATYHSVNYCVPAGSNILTTSQIICPRHYRKSFYNPKRRRKITPQTVNANWCFICSKGGDLICCETCPTSVHSECLPKGSFNRDETFYCEDCQSGRLPLYDEIVWVKLGNFRWWPAIILFPNEIPDLLHKVPHGSGEFVVKFFGTYDHYWVGRGRTFLFQEGDKGHSGTARRKVDSAFMKAIEEATQAHDLKKTFKVTQQAKKISTLKPPPYIRIKINKPVGNVRQGDGNISNTTSCDCDPTKPHPCGPDSDCLNRLLMTECNPEVCPAGDRCNNQRFEKREYPPLEPYKTEGRGWGLKTLAPIQKGQFVVEYVGEVIDDQEYQRRIAKMHEQKEENYYFLTIDKDRMLDAGPKGNVARFMNHSCQPNCDTQKWTVNGDTRVGLFANCDIPVDAELTFNYNLECVGKERKACHCGAENCSGFIGVKVKMDETQKRNKPKSKKKKSPVREVVIDEPCFVCNKTGSVGACNNKICSRYFHLKCVGLKEWPEGGKWVCPSHSCNVCSKRTIRYCIKCTDSFCPAHAESNIHYCNVLLGFICRNHDPVRKRVKREQSIGTKVRNLRKDKKSVNDIEVNVDVSKRPRENTSEEQSFKSDKEVNDNCTVVLSRHFKKDNCVTSTPVKTPKKDSKECAVSPLPKRLRGRPRKSESFVAVKNTCTDDNDLDLSSLHSSTILDDSVKNRTLRSKTRLTVGSVFTKEPTNQR